MIIEIETPVAIILLLMICIGSWMCGSWLGDSVLYLVGRRNIDKGGRK